MKKASNLMSHLMKDLVDLRERLYPINVNPDPFPIQDFKKDLPQDKIPEPQNLYVNKK